MIELMRAAEGIGLAGPQVGLPWRLFVAELPRDPEREAEEQAKEADLAGPGEGLLRSTAGPVVYVNPRIHDAVGTPCSFAEGCLSLPEIRGDVYRPPVVSITYTDLEGQTRTDRGGGLLARCWQHEMDHLDGVLIIDRMTQMSRLKNRSAVRSLERNG